MISEASIAAMNCSTKMCAESWLKIHTCVFVQVGTVSPSSELIVVPLLLLLGRACV